MAKDAGAALCWAISIETLIKISRRFGGVSDGADDTAAIHQPTPAEIHRIVDSMMAKVDVRPRDRDMGIEPRLPRHAAPCRAGPAGRAWL